MSKSNIKKISIRTDCGEYGCLFESNAPEKGYTVTVRDLEGVVTFGESLTEAKKMIKEAIELHCDDNVTRVSIRKRHISKWV